MPVCRPQEELLPRAARLRTEEDLESPNGRARGGSGPGGARAQRREQRSKPSSGVGGEPGPPVDGALLRIDEWLLDVDEHGTLLKVGAGQRARGEGEAG